MKRCRLFICAILVNLAQFFLCLLYTGGGPLIAIITIPLHLCVFFVNHKAGNTWPQVISLGAVHLTAAICTYRVYGELFFRNVHYDEVGEAIMFGITLIAAGLIVVLWIINITIFACRRRKQKKADRQML